MSELKIEYLPLDELTPYENNARKHEKADLQAIQNSIEQFEMCDPIGIWSDKNIIVEGHGRLLALKELGYTEAPCIRLDHLTDEQRRAYALAHNKTAEMSEWDIENLETELARLADDFQMNDFGFDDIEIPKNINESTSTKDVGGLVEKFIAPPFSVFDTRQGYWIDRKRLWREQILDDGTSRGDAQLMRLDTEKYKGIETFADVSLLDPVLCEIVMKWFFPTQGKKAFDCFAGDTVFGFVSAACGAEFTGIELREEQVEFNTQQVNRCNLSAKYICDDGRNVNKHLAIDSQDLFFSCPPYYDLEVYSDKNNDASNQATYEEFYIILDTAFTNAIKCLKNNRFAVIVVGDVRNKKTGEYYGFADNVKATFKRNGMILYNDIILLNTVGTAAIRASRYMESRKVAKIHQNVLVFYKGDTKEIQNNYEKIEYKESDFDESENE